MKPPTMLLMVIIASSLLALTASSRPHYTPNNYQVDGSNSYSYGKAYGQNIGHDNLRSHSYQNFDGSFGYSYQYGNPQSNVQVSFSSEPSYVRTDANGYQSAIKSGRPINYNHPYQQQQEEQHHHQYQQHHYRIETRPAPALSNYEDQQTSSSASNYHYSQNGGGPSSSSSSTQNYPAPRPVVPVYDGGAVLTQRSQTSNSYDNARPVHVDVDSSKQYPTGGHKYSVGTFKVPAFPADQTKYSSTSPGSGSGANQQQFRDLYQYHPDTFRYAHPETVVPLNVFGLPPQHVYQHPVGNVQSAVPIVVHTNAALPGPVVDSGVKKGSGHYEDPQKFARLYSQHPDTYRYVNPERNTPLNVFGLPPQHQFQSPYGNVQSFRPQEVVTNAQLPGPVVDVLLNRPSLSSSFTGRVPTTGDFRYGAPSSRITSYVNPAGQHGESRGRNNYVIPNVHQVPVKHQNYNHQQQKVVVETSSQKSKENSNYNRPTDDDKSSYNNNNRAKYEQPPYAKYSNGPVRYATIDHSQHRNVPQQQYQQQYFQQPQQQQQYLQQPQQQQQYQQSISVQQPVVVHNLQKEYFNLNPTIRYRGEDDGKNVLPLKLEDTLFRHVLDEDRNRERHRENNRQQQVTKSAVNPVRPNLGVARHQIHFYNNNDNSNRGHLQGNNKGVQHHQHQQQLPLNNFLMAQYPQPVTLRPVREYDSQPAANLQYKDNSQQQQYSDVTAYDSSGYHKQTPIIPQSQNYQQQQQQQGSNLYSYQEQQQQQQDQYQEGANGQSKRKYIYQRPPLDYTLIRLTPMRLQLAPPSKSNQIRNFNYVGLRNELDANRYYSSLRQPVSTSDDYPLEEAEPHRQSVRHIAANDHHQQQRVQQSFKPQELIQSRRYQYDGLDYTPIQSTSRMPQSNNYNRPNDYHQEQYKPGSLLAMLLPEFLKFGLGLTKSVTPISEPAKYTDYYGYSYNRPRKGFHVKLGLNPWLETKVLF